MAKVNPEFANDLAKYGVEDFTACFNCGNCTAICSLSTNESSFPREMIRYSSLGLEDEISASLKPWGCYYCGECSVECPRKANPGELMMTLRKWLSVKYDWTGLSGLFYKYLPVTITAMILILAGVIVFADSVGFDLDKMLHFGHWFEMSAIAAVFVSIFIPNLSRMWYFTVIKPKIKVRFKTYFTALGDLFVHMFTQKRARDCDDNYFRWLEHLVLVFSYLLLLFTTVFLNWFETENIFIIILGYIESAFIFIITVDFINDRLKKKIALAKHSQPSDWFFVIWLLLMGLSAFGVRLFIDLNILKNNYWMYLFHLTVLAQWAIIIVPFGKWTHFLYRSFAMYFDKVIKTSLK